MLVRRLLLTAALVAGCGGSSDDAAPRPSDTASGAATATATTYVDSINAICAAHLPLVLEATGGGHPQTYPIATFNAEAPKLKALRADFDAKVAAVAVPPGAADAAATLDFYRKDGDAAQAMLVAAAATGDQAKFDAAYDANAASFGAVSTRLTAAGFSQDCNAR